MPLQDPNRKKFSAPYSRSESPPYIPPPPPEKKTSRFSAPYKRSESPPHSPSYTFGGLINKNPHKLVDKLPSFYDYLKDPPYYCEDSVSKLTHIEYDSFLYDPDHYMNQEGYKVPSGSLQLVDKKEIRSINKSLDTLNMKSIHESYVEHLKSIRKENKLHHEWERKKKESGGSSDTSGDTPYVFDRMQVISEYGW